MHSELIKYQYMGRGVSKGRYGKWQQLRSGQSFEQTLAAPSGKQRMENTRFSLQLRLIKMFAWGIWETWGIWHVLATPISSRTVPQLMQSLPLSLLLLPPFKSIRQQFLAWLSSLYIYFTLRTLTRIRIINRAYYILYICIYFPGYLGQLNALAMHQYSRCFGAIIKPVWQRFNRLRFIAQFVCDSSSCACACAVCILGSSLPGANC